MADQILVELNEYQIVFEQQFSVGVVEETILTVIEETGVEILEVSEPGPAGAVGPQGPAGTPRIEVPFSFGDATPLELFVASAGKLIERLTIFIETAFDGENTSLSIGDEDDVSALMTTLENDPKEEAAYQVTPNLFYEVDTQVLLFITHGLGSSQGSGLVVVEMQT